MKFTKVPSCAKAFDTPNCALTTTPIDPAKLVTNAIMKNIKYIMIIGITLLFCLDSVIIIINEMIIDCVLSFKISTLFLQ